MTEPEQLGIGKPCPHCGVRAATLGTVCPACSRPYRQPDLLDWLPFSSDERVASRLMVFAWFAVVVFFVLLAIHNWVAAVLLGALGFGLLVAAIGLSNWSADRAEAKRRERR